MNKLFESQQNNIFTDLTIKLFDSDNNEIIINVHRIILYISCDYFKKLLTNFREKDQKEITLQVPNSHIAYDIVMSFYDQKTNHGNYAQWQYMLEAIVCYDFFGLEYDLSSFLESKFIELIENPEIYDSFLDTAQNICGFNDKTIQLLYNNLSLSYDLSKIPCDVLKKILQQYIEYDIMITTYGGNDYYVKTINTNDSHFELNYKVNDGDLVSFSNNKNCVAFLYLSQIKIENMYTGKSIFDYHTSKTYCGTNICLSHQSEIIALYNGNEIEIYHVETGILSKIKTKSFIRGICFSNDDKKLMSLCDEDNFIQIWDVQTGILIKEMYMPDTNILINCFSYDGERIVIVNCEDQIQIFNPITNDLVEIYMDTPDHIGATCVCFGSKNEIIVAGGNGMIYIWDIDSKKLIKFYRDMKFGIHYYKDEEHDEIIDIRYVPHYNKILKKIHNFLLKID